VGRRVSAWAALVAAGAVAGILGALLLFSHVSSHGSDCGTIVSPREPPITDPNSLIAGCDGARLGHTIVVLGCGALAVACIVVGLVMLRRDRPRTGDGQRKAPADRPPGSTGRWPLSASTEADHHRCRDPGGSVDEEWSRSGRRGTGRHHDRESSEP
jgi:hypothetical protein